jgi:hypothetical protein
LPENGQINNTNGLQWSYTKYFQKSCHRA